MAMMMSVTAEVRCLTLSNDGDMLVSGWLVIVGAGSRLWWRSVGEWLAAVGTGDRRWSSCS
jgi:hypothetical protein